MVDLFESDFKKQGPHSHTKQRNDQSRPRMAYLCRVVLLANRTTATIARAIKNMHTL